MKRLLKIAGIVLTVVLLASLFAFAVPVSAGSLLWTGVGTPLVATNQLLAANPNPGPIAFSPNFTTDKTVFAAVNDVTGLTAPVLYRSIDGGYTWVATSSVLGGALAGAIIVDVEVSPNYVNDRTVFVATADSTAPGASNSFVYRSTDGGATFGQLGVVTTAANAVITCMSVSPNYDGIGEIAVGIADYTAAAAAPAATNVQIWGLGGVLSWSIASGTGVVSDVAAIQYSPNYNIDSTLLVVNVAVAGQPVLRDCVGGVWNTIAAAGVNVGAAAVVDYDAFQAAIAANLMVADIALPSDYNGTTGTLRRAYVSIVDEAGAITAEATAATGTNVYRIDNVTPGVALYAAGVANVISNLDYAGTYTAGTLFGGKFATLTGAANLAADVYYSTNAMSAVAGSSPFFPATNPPTGAAVAGLIPAVGVPVGLNIASSTFVDAAADFATSLMVAAGTPGNDSAAAFSTDAGVLWNERGLIDNAGAALTFVAGSEIEMSPTYTTDNTMFMTSTNLSAAATNTNVWRTVDAGAHWDRVITTTNAAAGVGVLAISREYATDGVVYEGNTNAGAVAGDIQYSNSRGDGWAPRNTNFAVTATTIADMIAPNGTILYVADAAGGNVAKSLNSGWVWSGANTRASGSAGNLISIAMDGDTLVVGDNGGNVYRSPDASGTWAQVGATIVAGNNVYVAVKDVQVYAQLSGTGDVYRFNVGSSTAWYNPDAVAVLGLGIAISADDTLYALDPTAAANTEIRRSIEPLFGPAAPAPFFEWIAGLGAVAGRSISVASGGSNIIMLLEGTNNALWTYTDILSAGSTPPVLLGPATGVALTNTDQATYLVENVAGVTNWNLAFSNDETFTNGVDVGNNQVPPGTQIFVDISLNTVGVSNEAPIYWMARATLPLRGPWSESRVVNAEPQALVNAPLLNALAANNDGRVSVTPVLSWTAFHNATGYQVQVAIAHSPVVFTEANLIVDEVTGAVTTYAITEPLLYNQAYGWRVRALTAAGASDWSGAVGFLTEKEEAAPTAQPTYTINVPTSTITPTFTVTVPTSTTTPTTITPTWIYAIIVVGAVLVIAVIVLIVRTRRIS